MSNKNDPCVKFCCLLEKCTRKNNFQANRCQKEMENVLNCCKKFNPKMAPSCEGFGELKEFYSKTDEKLNKQ
ncbi:hypothetical protein NH340_JMT04585 [Sarcoptes scabiei]|nr:hypothetical protein NH340_JMT04585 [Sarcoptes scabiei]